MSKNIDLIDKNMKEGRSWYFGLTGSWWYGLDYVQAKQGFMEIEREKKVAIASIVRNEERSGDLGRFLDCCSDLELYHRNIVYIFVEGDSSDKTYDVLRKWVDERDGSSSGSILEKINKGCPEFPKCRDPRRIIPLGELRNSLVDLILSRSDIKEVLMIDANYGWKGDLISILRETNADIAAPLAVHAKNTDGKPVFFDIFAFRKNGAEFGPFFPYCQGFDPNNPIDIDSCGGAYLVKRSVFEAGARYDGHNDCEHVSFCKTARDKGFSVKLNPKVYVRKGGSKE